MIFPVKKTLCAVALILPTLILGAVVAQRLVELDDAPVVRLPIAGYDPVDILHGHYIQLRFDERAFAKKPNSYEMFVGDYCTCFNPTAPQTGTDGIALVGAYVQCKKKAELKCDLWANTSDFFTRPQKFFVDERYAAQLDKLVREAAPRRDWRRRTTVGGTPNPNLTTQQTPSQTPEPEAPPRVTMDVAVSPSGAVRLKMLYIDGKPWREAVGAVPAN